ncbi:hypothetical protein HD554DRAFT_2068380 [Boletus coccyginus]|nr:hypothetical protein HD554DRAFT_2068380 [Boletus coccyginus]
MQLFNQLPNPYWLAKLDSTRWFGKTIMGSWDTGLTPKRQRYTRSITGTHRADAVFSDSHRLYSSQSHLHPAFSSCWKHPPPRSQPAPMTTGCRRNGWNVRGSQLLLSITVRSESSSLETHADFCVASSIPPGRHRECAHTPVKYTSKLWFIPSNVAMPTTDEGNESNASWDPRRADDARKESPGIQRRYDTADI